ncbi:alpha/beta fold hydrolase [Enterobacteriaceae endosymbiont of Donacia tomentosa]|uniref:alpha/beta fold hydrolase n=1 Tax=Enterobacteriaceae endosymbiont of Donacia tomentosa TaxID=2675787 RepID=UPI0014494B7C|nr:alpha/beta fold hydrolase [Enterobacteriaceae endosymbiont of Donacia tomentosa]QJC31735.1 alpha/beta fold hydrolase [Enterobacteriaceae endosymbiont of Donacia tomentosa]
MILNNLILPAKNNISTDNTIIILHGLFGNKNSLYPIGNLLNKYLKCKIVLLDIRNHGLSPRHKNMDYVSLSKDVLHTLKFLNITNNIIIIGHSMGGKIAMSLTKFIPKFIKLIIILDIAPVKYTYFNKKIFHALKKIDKKNIFTRKEAYKIMQYYINNEFTINLLLKSFQFGKWEFDLFFLKNEYKNILNWDIIPQWMGKILFLKGMQSNYINKDYYNQIFRQFPFAKIYNIPYADHNLHIKNTKLVLQKILDFYYT